MTKFQLSVSIHCLCLVASVLAQSNTVTPINWSRFNTTGASPDDKVGSDLAKIIQKQTRHMLNWLASDHEIKSDIAEWKGLECYYPDFSYRWEHAVRPLSHIAFSTAVVLKTGVYSPEVTGISRADAIKRVEYAIRGAAFTHKSNRASDKRWGDMWQSAYWASETAQAAWMLWDEISDETKRAVVNMVEHEANRFLDYTIPYSADRNGKMKKAGDTKAEENAWNSRILIVGLCMMPNHPNKDRWRERAIELMISAYSRPSDLKSNKVINGKPLKEWLNGSNITEEGLVVNHNRVHPDYAAAIFINFTAWLDCSLAGVPVPAGAFHNHDVVYHAMTEYQFKPGKSPFTKNEIQPPGGTILRRDEKGNYIPAYYYPEKADWTTVAYDNIVLDIYSEIRGLDKGKDWDCMGWIRARLDALEKQQNRPGHDGNLYEKGDWLTEYRNTDAVAFQALTEAWTIWWLNQQGKLSPVQQ